jgi:photosystem II stability/assembly factor-like uncharacterized protein
MKRTLLLILLFNINCVTNAQWQWQNPLPVGSINLNAIYFTSPDVGWIAGELGTIINTTDGGINWNIQECGTSEDLTSVYFASSTVGWAVGKNGIILNTTDGGINWTSQTSGTSENLTSVFFV